MADVEGLSPEELENQGATVEAVVAAALAVVAEQAAASVLAGIPAVIGTGLPAYPWVSLDDVAIVPTLWLRQLDAQVMPAVRAVFDQTAEHVHQQIQAAVDANPTLYGTPEFDLPGEVVEPPPVPEIPDVTAEQLMAAARNRLVGIGDTLWADIRQQIVEGIGVGESIEQLAKRIEATAGVAEPRARTIARTEVVSTSNGAAIAQARSAGVPMTKSWLDTHDTRTRPTHKEAGRTQQRIPLDQPFEVGGFQLDFPGDPSGPPQEVINERCAIGFELGIPEPLVAAVGRKTAADPYLRDNQGQFAKTGTPDLSKMKVPELRAEVKKRGLKGLSKATKPQLIEALQRADEQDAPPPVERTVEPPKPRSRAKTSAPRAAAVPKSPDVLAAEEHARNLVKDLPAGLRKEVLDSLIVQASLKPRSVRTLQGFGLSDLGNAGAQYFPGRRGIDLNSRWKTNKRQLNAAGRASLNDGYLSPTGSPSVLGAYVAHEFGHHVAFGRYDPTSVGMPKAFADRLFGALARSIGTAPPRSTRALMPWRDIESWMSTNRGKLRTAVSEYGAETIHELLAEIWQEFSTQGDNARPAAKAVGAVLQGTPPPVTAAVGRKTAADPYIRDTDGKFAETGVPDLSKLKVTELRAQARKRGLKGLSKAPKAQLVEALRQLDKADSGSGKAGKVDSLPRIAKRQPALAAAKATNPNFGSTNNGPAYYEQGKAGGRWTPRLGPLPGGAFEENCTNAVNAFEMRMRGYDVTAAPLDVLSKYGYAAGRTFKEFDELFTEAWRLPDGKPHGRSMASQKWRSFAEIDSEIERDWPDGGRGVITVGKHVFNVVKERGKARYVEAQYDATPSRNVTRLYKSRFKGYDGWSAGIQEGKLIRLDDLVPIDSILETVEAAK